MCQVSDGNTRGDYAPEVRGALEGFVEGGDVPGFVAAIYRSGDLTFVESGRMSLDSDARVEVDSIFRISSMSKPVTAVATLVLVERGVLSLDAPVHEYLPELADRRVVAKLDGPIENTVAARRAFTVRDLLTFTFGFGALFAPCPIVDAASALEVAVGPPQPARAPAPDEWLRRFATLPLMHQPGERWMYHTGSDLLGILISRVSGQDFTSFLTDHVLSPLSMNDTGFYVPAERLSRFGPCYQFDATTDSLTVFDPVNGQWSVAPAFASGGAGLVSTAVDYLRFAGMLLRGGAPIVSSDTVAEMTSDQLTTEQKSMSGFGPGFFDTIGWGFGVSVTTAAAEGAGSLGQYGWSGGLGTLWFNDPARDLAAVLMTNRMWSSPTPPPIAAAFASVVNAIT